MNVNTRVSEDSPVVMRTRVETAEDVFPRVILDAGASGSSSTASSSSSSSSSSGASTSASSSSVSRRWARAFRLGLFVVCEADCFRFLVALALAVRDAGIERFCGVIDGVSEFERDAMDLEC